MSAIYSLNHRHIGRASGDGAFADRVRYVTRNEALIDLITRNLPENVSELQTWALGYPRTLRSNARVADILIVAVPNGLGRNERSLLLHRFLSLTTNDQPDAIRWFGAFHDGLSSDEVARIARGDGACLTEADIPLVRNDHAHLVICDWRVDWNSKRGGAVIHTTKLGSTDLFRQAWAQATNELLEKIGRSERITHLSLEAQMYQALARGDFVAAAALDRPPGLHIGGAGLGMERRGEATTSMPTAMASRINDDRSYRIVKYTLIDKGRSRAAEAARRQKLRDDAAIRAENLRHADEARRCAAGRRMLEAAIARLLSLQREGQNRKLARRGGPEMILMLEARLASLPLIPRTELSEGASSAVVQADEIVNIATISAQHPPTAPAVLRPFAVPGFGRIQPLAARPLSSALQTCLPTPAPSTAPWAHQQARAVAAYAQDFAASMTARVEEAPADPSRIAANAFAIMRQRKER